MRTVSSSFAASSRCWRTFERGGGSATSAECRACHFATETVDHLVIERKGEACKSARATWYASVLRWAYETAADIDDFLRQRLTLTAGGGLPYADDVDTAFGFVTGALPTDFLRLYV